MILQKAPVPEKTNLLHRYKHAIYCSIHNRSLKEDFTLCWAHATEELPEKLEGLLAKSRFPSARRVRTKVRVWSSFVFMTFVFYISTWRRLVNNHQNLLLFPLLIRPNNHMAMSSDIRHAIVYDHRNRKLEIFHENIFAITFRELRRKLSPAKLHKSSHRSQQDRLSWCVDVAWLRNRLTGRVMRNISTKYST